ncbi:MAG TPA: long-chain fatty acid--CoA ligase, partial [Acidobacteriota bacterium]|nr:long-chain fatty acid--CoA ligase [Acidobacteriota bacterium]
NNRVEWLLADWANICIGALTVPVYGASSAAQAAHIIVHADPTVLIVDSQKRLDRLEFLRIPLGQLKAIVVMNDEAIMEPKKLHANLLTLEGLRQEGHSYEERHPGVFELLVRSLRPEDDLTIIYTSGTTGAPKGVLTTHAQYLFMIQAVDAAVPSTDRDVTLHFLPTAHSLGRLEHFMAVAKGWTLAIARSIETTAVDLKIIRPTVIFSVPRIYENSYRRILQRLNRTGGWRRRCFDWGIAAWKDRIEGSKPAKGFIWFRRLTLACVDRMIFARLRAAFGGRLRLAISGGAPLAREIAEFFQAVGITILEGYGLTETSTVSHVNRPGRIKLSTVGLPLDGTACRIADDGEILLRGPHIFKCYFRDLIATKAVIDDDGWFHTGDIGEIDGEGFLCVTERKSDLIVTSGGKKVAPQKLENLLGADPLIHQAVIIGRGRRHLMALITLDRQRAIDLARVDGIAIANDAPLANHPWAQARVRGIIQRANKELAAYEAIRNFCILDHEFTVDSDELTPTLKPRRQTIVERYKEQIEDMYRRAS